MFLVNEKKCEVLDLLKLCLLSLAGPNRWTNKMLFHEEPQLTAPGKDQPAGTHAWLLQRRKYWAFTEFHQGVSLLAMLHIGKIHLPAFKAFLVFTAFVSTLELTWKTRKHI